MGALGSWAAAVIIPAHNEADSIAACLHSVLMSADCCPPAATCWTVVVADTCSDATARIAREILSDRGEVIECEVASVGSARRLGTSAALRHLHQHPIEAIWLANTDADTQVPRDWLTQQLVYARRGFKAVAGTVAIGAVLQGGCDISAALMADYQVNADGTHSHVHGANLGVCADAYLDAGGWSDARLAEDHCLWHRLRARMWALVASSSVCVHTSGRLQGRAAGGFATTLGRKVESLCA